MRHKQHFSPRWVAALVLAWGCMAAAGPLGLVGYWTFDEGQGVTAFDSSGNGLDGTLKGNPKWVSGQLGGALDFDGSDDYVEIPDDPLLAITTEITIAAWTNMRATASDEMAIVSKGGWAANDLPYELTETRGGVIFWQFYNDAGRDSCSPNSPPAGEWHHIAATYDGASFQCYVDGALAEEWAYAGKMPVNTAAVNIGRRSRGGTFFNGLIDDVAIYNRALTVDEIQSTMEGHLQENPRANRPNPRDGDMIYQTQATLKWQPGDSAKLHEVYFGESLDQVTMATAADADVFCGRQAVALLSVGVPGGRLPAGLVPGTTYYWRIDEVNDANPNSPWKGDIWRFQVQPLTAYQPFPVDGMKYVDPDQNLSW
ncbi:MAG: LamG domain-containing protein, partial [Planctomycetes bacterium]|nr:LamG domain-containing protein [Planctomycetota bacterium]